MGPGITSSALGGNAASAVRLKLLGDFGLSIGDVDMRPRGRKACGLLAYLSVAPRHALSRERAADLLWGDRGNEQARASLRQTVAELRGIEELDAVLAIGRDTIGFGPAMPAIDIDELIAGAERMDAAALASGLAEAGGAFLADLDGLSPVFDEWLSAERARQQERLFTAILTAADTMIGEHLAAELPAILRALDRLDPWNEAVARLAMRVDHVGGDFASLHRRYRALTRGLADEYQAEPTEETRALYHQLSAAEAGPSAPAQPAAATAAPSRSTPPTIFVGAITALGASEQSQEIAAIITDDIRTALGRHRDLRVLLLDTVDLADLQESCRDALAAYMLSGRLRQVGGDLRVNLQLGNVHSGAIAWSDQIAVRSGDLASDIDHVVAKAVGAVAPTIERDLTQLPPAQGDQRDDSVILYAEARRAVRNANTLDETRAGAALLESLVQRDPSHIGARMLLARLYNTDYWQRLAGHDVAAMRARAADLVREASALDPGDVAIHLRLAWCHLRQGNWIRAEHGLRQAAGALPFDADNLNICAFGLCHLGHAEEAEQLMQRAFLLNPFPPSDFHADFAVMKMLQGDAETAEEHFEISGESGLQYLALRLANITRLPDADPVQTNTLGDAFSSAFRQAWESDREPELADITEWARYTFPLKREEDKALVGEGLSRALAPDW